MSTQNFNSKSSKSNKIVIAAVTAALLGTAGVFAGLDSLKASTALTKKPVATVQTQPTVQLPVNIADVVERVSPAVVSIMVTHKASPQMSGMTGNPFEEFFEKFFDEDAMRQFRQGRPNPGFKNHGAPRGQGIGSGFIIDKTGLVVTNNHVIDNAEEIQVQLDDGRTIDAKLVGADPKTDLALLKIQSDEEFTAVQFGDSASMRVGDWVITLGNPFGIGKTATTGIVSARHRNIGAGPFDDFLQIDAPINKGNSGGPAFNAKGEVIGVNTAIFSPSGGNVGIGFAIPSNQARQIIAQLKDGGVVERGWLGVHIQQVTPEIAESLGLEKAKGALVSKVAEGSPAEKAGLKRGDVILEVEDEDVRALRDLPRIIAAIKAGTTSEITVWRDRDEVELDVKIGAQSKTEKVADAGERGVQGMQLAELDDRTRAAIGVDNSIGGVVITKVERGSSAAKTGLRRGDVIVAVGNTSVNSPDEVAQLVNSAKSKDRKAVLMLMLRQGNELFVALPLKNA